MRIVYGLVAGSAVILMAYGLLAEEVRFSRAVLLLGSLWTLLIVPALRFLLHWSGIGSLELNGSRNRRFVIVGQQREVERVELLLRETFRGPEFIGHVSSTDVGFDGALGTVVQLDEVIRIHAATEVIFCAADMPARQIIDIMTQTAHQQVDFKIAPQEGMFLIGSNSINTAGDLYTFGINPVSKASNMRLRRLFDVTLSLLLMVLLPLVIWTMRRPMGLFRNIMLTFIGRRTWVGYARDGGADRDFHLPKLAAGVLSPLDGLDGGELDAEGLVRINLRYAKDYSVLNDLAVVLKGFRELGRV